MCTLGNSINPYGGVACWILTEQNLQTIYRTQDRGSELWGTCHRKRHFQFEFSVTAWLVITFCSPNERRSDFDSFMSVHHPAISPRQHSLSLSFSLSLSLLLCFARERGRREDVIHEKVGVINWSSLDRDRWTSKCNTVYVVHSCCKRVKCRVLGPFLKLLTS